MKVVSYKTEVVRPLTSHLTHHLRRVRYALYCSESKSKLMSKGLSWTPTRGHTSVSRPAKICIHQLCADTECRWENLARTLVDRDEWWNRERERERESESEWEKEREREREREARNFLLSAHLVVDDDDDENLFYERESVFPKLTIHIPNSLSIAEINAAIISNYVFCEDWKVSKIRREINV